MPAPGGQEGDEAEGDGADDERVVDAQEGSVGEVPAKVAIWDNISLTEFNGEPG